MSKIIMRLGEWMIKRSSKFIGRSRAARRATERAYRLGVRAATAKGAGSFAARFGGLASASKFWAKHLKNLSKPVAAKLNRFFVAAKTFVKKHPIISGLGLLGSYAALRRLMSREPENSATGEPNPDFYEQMDAARQDVSRDLDLSLIQRLTMRIAATSRMGNTDDVSVVRLARELGRFINKIAFIADQEFAELTVLETAYTASGINTDSDYDTDYAQKFRNADLLKAVNLQKMASKNSDLIGGIPQEN